MPSKDFILFFDLEATGSGDDEQMLEIGCVMVDSSPFLREVARKKIVLPLWPSEVPDMAEVVVQMHKRNGLLDECLEVAKSFSAFWKGIDERPRILREIDVELAGWVKTFSRKSHIPLAGSGVPHYDRKYIKRDLPFFNSTLTHYALDIGSTRRQLALAGVDIPTKFGFKTHRADEDAAFHAQEMRDFIAWARRK